MAAEVVNPALGTQLRHGIASTYTAIAQIFSLDGPDRGVETRETSNLASTARTYAPKIVANGKLSGVLQYDPQGATQTILEGLISAPGSSPVEWQVHFPDTTNGATNHTFVGILTKFSPTGEEIDNNLLANFEIQISGLVTSAIGT